MNDFPDGRDINVKMPGDGCKARIYNHSPDLDHGVFGESGKIVSFTLSALTTLGVRIFLVVRLSTCEEMVGIAAWRIVARVANKIFRGQWSYKFLIDGTRSKFATGQSTTSVFCFVLPGPRPAFIRTAFLDSRPQLIVPTSKSTDSTKFTLKRFLPPQLGQVK